MHPQKIKVVCLQMMGVLIAALLYVVALRYFIMPSKVILTGFEGISLSFAYYFDDMRVFVWLYVAFQFCLFIFACRWLSWRFALLTALLVGVVASLITVLPPMEFARPESENERIMLVVFGGLIVGMAKALAFKNRGSTGDEDVVATYISQKKLKPVGNISIIAGTISTLVGLGLTYLKTSDFSSVINTAMYTAVYIFVSAVSLNTLFKKYQLTKIIITTQKTNEIAEAITGFAEKKTFTLHEGMGGYSRAQQSIISTIIPHEELSDMVRQLKKTDPQAFIYYHDIEGVEAQIHVAPIA